MPLRRREQRRLLRPGGNTSPEGIFRLRLAGGTGSRGRGTGTAPAAQSSSRSQPATPGPRSWYVSTWCDGSDTRSSPGCPSGSAWRPAPAGLVLRGISASQSCALGSAAGSQ